MINKHITWYKLDNETYQVREHSDDSMFTLAMFLEDGIGYQTYKDFLENKQKHDYGGNMSYLEKHDEMVTIEIDDYIFPNLPHFTTSIVNLITILKEFERLRDLNVDKIEIIFENDILTINGDWIN